jgi:phosphohistidine phosphatase SixA
MFSSWAAWATASHPEVARLLRAGRAVAVFRHAEAPGTYDPPDMRLGDCSTQRNLDDAGRDQARRMGAWFTAQGLDPLRVRSSPWCRCLDTARGGFGRAEPWSALGSPQGLSDSDRAAQWVALRAALADLPSRGFEVWVTHNFVIADLAGVSTASAEGVVLGPGQGGAVRVLARLPAA